MELVVLALGHQGRHRLDALPGTRPQQPRDVDRRPVPHCIGSAVMASIGLLLWMTEKGAFKGKGRKIAVTALTNAHARLIIGAFGSGYAIGMAFNCFWELW